MSLVYDNHYASLQQKLLRHQVCRGRGGSALRITEIRLAIAWRYRRQMPLVYTLVTPIQYWRHYWPRIEAVVKYEELRYILALFPPKGAKSQRRATLLEEMTRRTRHMESNPRLYAYIRLDCHDQDARLFGQDPAIVQSNSEWLTGCWAFDRYATWLNIRYREVLAVDARGRQGNNPKSLAGICLHWQ
jgi:hypothetical protein